MHRVSSSKGNREPYTESAFRLVLLRHLHISLQLFPEAENETNWVFQERFLHSGHAATGVMETRPGNAHNNSPESVINYVHLGVHDAEEESSNNSTLNFS